MWLGVNFSEKGHMYLRDSNSYFCDDISMLKRKLHSDRPRQFSPQADQIYYQPGQNSKATTGHSRESIVSVLLLLFLLLSLLF